MEPEALQRIKDRAVVSRRHSERMRGLMPEGPAPSLRVNFARCAIDLALEHHSALIRVVDGGEYGTAGALLRPVFEASTTAYWFIYCATCAEIQGLPTTSTDNPVTDVPDMSKMLMALTPTFPPIQKISDGLKAGGSAKWLHKYTHGSAPQLARRVGDRWTGDEVMLTLIRADLFSVLAACLETVIAPREELTRYGFGTRDELGREMQMTFGTEAIHQQPHYLPPAPFTDGCGPPFG